MRVLTPAVIPAQAGIQRFNCIAKAKLVRESKTKISVKIKFAKAQTSERRINAARFPRSREWKKGSQNKTYAAYADILDSRLRGNDGGGCGNDGEFGEKNRRSRFFANFGKEDILL